jgi:hypothetical protein
MGWFKRGERARLVRQTVKVTMSGVRMGLAAVVQGGTG